MRRHFQERVYLHRFTLITKSTLVSLTGFCPQWEECTQATMLPQHYFHCAPPVLLSLLPIADDDSVFERGLWRDELRLRCVLCRLAMKKDPERASRSACCAHRLMILASQPDFLAQRSFLEEECDMLGVRVLFLPKFHCEVNYIEYLWGSPNEWFVLAAATIWMISKWLSSKR